RAATRENGMSVRHTTEPATIARTAAPLLYRSPERDEGRREANADHDPLRSVELVNPAAHSDSLAAAAAALRIDPVATRAARVQRAGRDHADVVVDVRVAGRTRLDLVGAVPHRREGLVRGQVGQGASTRQTGRRDALHRFGENDHRDVVRVALRVVEVRILPE